MPSGQTLGQGTSGRLFDIDSHTNSVADGVPSQKEALIASKLHKFRYQCKFHLQLCAVLSQVNKHQEAFEIGKRASKLSEELIKCTHHLCQKYVKRVKQALKGDEKEKNTEQNGASTNAKTKGKRKGDELCSPYSAKNSGVKRSGANSASGSISAGNTNQGSGSARIGDRGRSRQRKGRRPLSASAKESRATQDDLSDDSVSSTTSIRITKSVERDSLEKIHTFSLKQTSTNNSTGVSSSIGEDASAEKASSNSINLRKKESENTQGNGAKTFYVEEKIKVLENVIIKAEPVINGLIA